MFQCRVIHPECSFETDKLSGIKRHLSMSHQSWTDEKILAIVNAASATEGAAPTGARNFAEAAATAPATDAAPEDQPKRRRRSKAEMEQAAVTPPPLTEYQSTIIERVAHLLAILPWLILSYIWGEPGMELGNIEAKTIQAGFKDIFGLLQWRPASIYWAPMIVAEEEYKAGQVRWPIIQEHVIKKPKVKKEDVAQPENQ